MSVNFSVPPQPACGSVKAKWIEIQGKVAGELLSRGIDVPIFDEEAARVAAVIMKNKCGVFKMRG